MPSLTEHQARKVVKLLLIGDSGTGKTGSLVSLVKAGYKLGIIDFDNLLRSLVEQIRKQCPDKMGNVYYKTFADKIVSSMLGPIVEGTPTAFNDAVKMMGSWDDGESKLGPPGKWGPEWVLVIDTLTRMGECALRWGEFMTPKGKESGKADGRAPFFTAQGAILDVMNLINAEAFNTNVILMAHATYQEYNGAIKGFPRTVGKAIGPDIPGFFENVLLVETQGQGSNAFRSIRAVTNGMVETKSPFLHRFPELAAPMSLDEGLAKYFAAARKE